MITPSQIYWLAKLDDVRALLDTDGMIGGLSIAATVISAIVTAILSIVVMAVEDEATNNTINAVRKCCKRAWVALGLSIASMMAFGIACAFVPSTKQMAAIVVIPRIANSETVSELGDLGKDLIVLAKEWVEELKPPTKKDK